MVNKLESLLGFAVKSGKVVFGYDNLMDTRKKVKMIIFSPSLSEKVKGKLKLYAEAKNMILAESKELLEDLIHRDNCKVVGLTDINMISAIRNLENLNIISRE